MKFRTVPWLGLILLMAAGCQTTGREADKWHHADHAESRLTVISNTFGVSKVETWGNQSDIDVERATLTYSGSKAGSILYQETSAYYSGFSSYNLSERMSVEALEPYIKYADAERRAYPFNSKIINSERIDYVDIEGSTRRCLRFITLMGGAGNVMADGRILLSGHLCAYPGSLIHARLEQELFDLLRDLRTDGSDKSNRASYASYGSNSKTDYSAAAALSASELCTNALTRATNPDWKTHHAFRKYVDEAKRRGFNITKCKKTIDVDAK
jgi:hypothetical protein